MQGFTTSNSWSTLSAPRFNQIIGDQLAGIKVDRTWYEALCDFLTNCFSCYSDSAITNGAIIKATKGLVSAQIQLCEIIEKGSSTESASDCCDEQVKRAFIHALRLAKLCGNRSVNNYEIELTPNENMNINNAMSSNEPFCIAIFKKNCAEPLFYLHRFINDEGTLVYNMATLPDPRSTKNQLAKHPQNIYLWQTQGQRCNVEHTETLNGQMEKEDFFKKNPPFRHNQ